MQNRALCRALVPMRPPHTPRIRLRYISLPHGLQGMDRMLGRFPMEGKMMPSRAFCSDENQGFAIMKITKHFGTFPFNHGRAGGMLEDDRHGPHAAHGRDLVIIQASHVGYDPETGHFGSYMRQHHDIPGTSNSTNLHRRTFVSCLYGQRTLESERRLVPSPRAIVLNRPGCTYKIFEAPLRFIQYLGSDYVWKPYPGEVVGEHLHPEIFYFRRKLTDPSGRDRLEANIRHIMPYIVTSTYPPVAAAQANVQVEFDRSYRTMRDSPVFKGKKVFFFTGLNVDISPKKQVVLPVTATMAVERYGTTPSCSMNRLCAQSVDNPEAVDLESVLFEELQDAKRTQRQMPFKLPHHSL
eukprot:g39363.t1